MIKVNVDKYKFIQDLESPGHVKYLWDAKLKSRNSFLLVLEFIPLYIDQLKTFLTMLKLEPEFWLTYI